MTMTETRSLIDAERDQLLTVLDGLDDAAWVTPSLCTGWTVRDVAAHLLMPYELAVPKLLVGLVRARFSFDRFAANWATADPRTTSEISAALRNTGNRSFNVPGASPESELSHLACHAEDIYRPLGITNRTSANSREVVLNQLVSHRGGIQSGLLDGLRITATDVDWIHGDGRTVTGTTSAILTTLIGRAAALDELSGPGAGVLRDRLTPPAE